MKLRAACVCRNEADVIRETLLHAATFCDEIYVYDLNSTDATVDIVRELEDNRIHLFDSTSVPFHDGRHADVWQSLWKEDPTRFKPEDWYMMLDADEQLVRDPRPVLFSRAYRLVNKQRTWQVTHFFTTVDERAWQAGDQRPSAQRLKYFELARKLEPRFFRCAPDAYWPSEPSPEYPRGCRLPLSCRHEGWAVMLNRHFQYRSPAQIERRFATREANRLSGGLTARQWDPALLKTLREVPAEKMLLWSDNRYLGNLSPKDKMRVIRWSAYTLVTTLLIRAKDEAFSTRKRGGVAALQGG